MKIIYISTDKTIALRCDEHEAKVLQSNKRFMSQGIEFTVTEITKDGDNFIVKGQYRKETIV
jgi:hypothetical protein